MTRAAPCRFTLSSPLPPGLRLQAVQKADTSRGTHLTARSRETAFLNIGKTVGSARPPPVFVGPLKPRRRKNRTLNAVERIFRASTLVGLCLRQRKTPASGPENCSAAKGKLPRVGVSVPRPQFHSCVDRDATNSAAGGNEGIQTIMPAPYKSPLLGRAHLLRDVGLRVSRRCFLHWASFTRAQPMRPLAMPCPNNRLRPLETWLC